MACNGICADVVSLLTTCHASPECVNQAAYAIQSLVEADNSLVGVLQGMGVCSALVMCLEAHTDIASVVTLLTYLLEAKIRF
jgi:hypothetical protein